MAAPDQCIRRRECRLWSNLGYERFWSGRLTEARAAYRQSLRLQPLGRRWLRPLLYCAATLVGPRGLAPNATYFLTNSGGCFQTPG